MRALLIAVLALAALWAGYWFVGSRLLERSVEDWIAAQPAAGYEASASDVSVQGFPNRFDLTVTEPRLADPQAGIAWAAPFAQVFAMTWKPWHVIAALPDRQTVTLPQEEVTVTSSRLRGSLVVTPGTELTLDRATVEGDGLRLSSTRGWETAVSRMLLATRRSAEDASAHEIWLEAHSLTPDQAFRMEMQSRSDLPELIDRVEMDAVAGFTAPIDRFAPQTQPRLNRLSLGSASIKWGRLSLSAKGSVQPGRDGIAEGRIDLRAEPWRDLIPVIVAAGLITADFAPNVERALELLARQGSNPDVLEVPLAFTGGRMSLGPIPLGPAPRLE